MQETCLILIYMIWWCNMNLKLEIQELNICMDLEMSKPFTDEEYTRALMDSIATTIIERAKNAENL